MPPNTPFTKSLVGAYIAVFLPWLLRREFRTVDGSVTNQRSSPSYPYPNEYKVWPGPNSNTFMAYIGRQVPELHMDLPATAIGKDYPSNGSLLDRTPSGTGYQLSMLGVLGLSMAREEGVELNLLGLSFGIDFYKPALKLPFIARIGAGEH